MQRVAVKKQNQQQRKKTSTLDNPTTQTIAIDTQKEPVGAAILANRNETPHINTIVSASTETNKDNTMSDSFIEITSNTANDDDTTTPTSSTGTNESASSSSTSVASYGTATPTSIQMMAPYDPSKMDKSIVALLNLHYYVAYGKPLSDGSDSYSQYAYGKGKTSGFLGNRGQTFDGFSETYDYPARLALFDQARNAILTIDSSTFNNQKIRNQLADNLRAALTLCSRTYFTRMLAGTTRLQGYMENWINSYLEVYEQDGPAKQWLIANQNVLSTTLVDASPTNNEFINIDTPIDTLTAFSQRESEPIKKNHKDLIRHFMMGQIRESIADTYLYHNLDPKAVQQLTFDGDCIEDKKEQKRRTQSEEASNDIPLRTFDDFNVSYLIFKLHDVLIRTQSPTLSTIQLLFMAQTLHHKINRDVNRPTTFLEIDLQSDLIRAMLLHKEPAALQAQVNKSLGKIFARPEDKKQYQLDILASKRDQFTEAEFIAESLRLAKVPGELISALRFRIGDSEDNDCTHESQAIQALLNASQKISLCLKGLLLTHKPTILDAQLGLEFLNKMATFVKEPKVIQHVNTWLDPSYATYELIEDLDANASDQQNRATL